MSAILVELDLSIARQERAIERADAKAARRAARGKTVITRDAERQKLQATRDARRDMERLLREGQFLLKGVDRVDGQVVVQEVDLANFQCALAAAQCAAP